MRCGQEENGKVGVFLPSPFLSFTVAPTPTAPSTQTGGLGPSGSGQAGGSVSADQDRTGNAKMSQAVLTSPLPKRRPQSKCVLLRSQVVASQSVLQLVCDHSTESVARASLYAVPQLARPAQLSVDGGRESRCAVRLVHRRVAAAARVRRRSLRRMGDRVLGDWEAVTNRCLPVVRT